MSPIYTTKTIDAHMADQEINREDMANFTVAQQIDGTVSELSFIMTTCILVKIRGLFQEHIFLTANIWLTV